jgi:hypothetical protein
MTIKRLKYSIVLLLVFVLVYPFIWYNSYNKRLTAAGYVKGYNGETPPNDPWGTPYHVFRVEEEGMLTVIITCAGPDHKLGTRDDIRGGYRKTVSIEVK